eukprot:scaffold561_cov44-Prasinocladus_malaysianus.AAC.2
MSEQATKVAEFTVTGNSYAPDGVLRDHLGALVEHPPDHPCMLALAVCGATCNNATITYHAKQGAFRATG